MCSPKTKPAWRKASENLKEILKFTIQVESLFIMRNLVKKWELCQERKLRIKRIKKKDAFCLCKSGDLFALQ